MTGLATIDVLAGTTFLVLAIVAARRSARFAAVAMLAAASWFLADTSPSLLLIHRPLLLLAAFSHPNGRVRHRYPMGVLLVSVLGAIVQPVGQDPVFMVALGAAVLVEAARLSGRSPVQRRAFGTGAAPASFALGLSLAVPAAGRLWAPGAVAGDTGLTLYTGLVAVAGAILLTGLVVRSHPTDTDSLIELSETTPDQTLVSLRSELAHGRSSAARPALVAATRLLEANAELQGELALRVEEVRESRSRIVAAAVAERQRLETILSSGAMRHLDDLAVTLVTLHGLCQDGTVDLVTAALDEVGRSRDDLEQLARGLHPRLLAEHGLGAALTDLAARCPLPITVRVPQQRHPESVESAVWYACAEAVANVVKHSGARRATVDVRENAGEIVAEIRDDGVGGAELAPGGGLAGLEDRLGTVEGRIAVLPGTGGGTTVLIRVPLP